MKSSHVILILLVAGGGLAAYFLLRGRKAHASTGQVGGVDIPAPTNSGTTNMAISPSTPSAPNVGSLLTTVVKNAPTVQLGKAAVSAVGSGARAVVGTVAPVARTVGRTVATGAQAVGSTAVTVAKNLPPVAAARIIAPVAKDVLKTAVRYSPPALALKAPGAAVNAAKTGANVVVGGAKTVGKTAKKVWDKIF